MKCSKCKSKEKVFLYNILPRCWYHGSGKMIYLCKDCIYFLNKKYPLEFVIGVIQCEERIKSFLKL